MTTLLVQATSAPLMIDLPWIMPMTEEQFYEFCLANRDLRIERSASGEVIVMPPAFSDTGNRNLNIAVQLGSWSELDGTGLGFDSSAGFTLPNGAIRSPDAAWIKLERWNALTEKQKASFAPICPDFVIELRSASDRVSSLQKKMEEYIANGTLLGWLIERQNRQVYIYRPHREPEILNDPETVSGDPELPGFELVMAKIW
ncbi:MAG: Uma2 family endonuclease [Microcystis aeruginosa LL13-03]|jgi:Uma2 family endonuclease|uniref:Uma2 family endonuclease n=1 Tax=Microcystis aeruginosa G11-04 TaxID=2685956 RepID=A0A966L4G9_MICAE|nr:Uma2 family endonuclease [Microcystis aeruginosa LL13-03]NCR89691.1 Uma2 family endonuclease [Microcystis aeruginosa G13-10]NCS02796.1 Uma2 family endonuclease [Microcystis aeruginosa G13-11]NCS06250.1 Uma2 family endonuclease [Microcystis aeruginosa G13-07]NCS35063.1 Uma2 family endonuclease [Microcystis aeruginosa G11-01]NCS56783.1 Uma2 family endonuclease [Microcystis aeruginosa G11-04]NCT42901.1 Uma2 family endonuclease [Microcystis aeruginosa G11-09]